MTRLVNFVFFLLKVPWLLSEFKCNILDWTKLVRLWHLGRRILQSVYYVHDVSTSLFFYKKSLGSWDGAIFVLST